MNDELIVESLDGRAHLTLRARVVAGIGAISRHLHRPAWLTRRRVGVAALSLALLVALALSVTGLAAQWWEQGRLAVLWHFAPTYTRTTIHAGAPGTLAAAWERIPLPPTGDRMDALVVSPTDPQAALACTGPQSDPKTYETKDGPITLWRTRDGGQHWQRVGIPTTTGTFCTAQVTEGAPQRLLLVVSGTGGCQASHPLFSTDGGQHWRVLSPPLPPLPAKMESCWLGASVAPRHLYASVSTSVLLGITNGTANYQTAIWNTRSDDDGRTWTPPANDMSPTESPVWSLSSTDGQTITLAAGYIQQGKAPTLNTHLWVSRDAGASWQPLGTLPGFYATRLTAPPGVTLVDASAHKPAYAVSGEGSNWTILHVQVAQISGQTWAPLPPLPVGGASAERMGITGALTATPDGKLLALGLGPHASIPSDGTIADIQTLDEWLWEWDPVAARWSAIASLPSGSWPSPCADHCWRGEIAQGAGPQGSGTYLWLVSNGGGSATPTVLRARLPGA
jgi:photosystem II stability/assembly factor-like uncharacterized protein